MTFKEWWDKLNPQQQDRYKAKWAGYRASHPGKPRGYYQRPNVPDGVRREQARRAAEVGK